MLNMFRCLFVTELRFLYFGLLGFPIGNDLLYGGQLYASNSYTSSHLRSDMIVTDPDTNTSFHYNAEEDYDKNCLECQRIQQKNTEEREDEPRYCSFLW